MMQYSQLLLGISVYGIALWLGAYLISRNPGNVNLRYAGLGLLAYAIGIGLDILIAHGADTEWAASIILWRRPFLYLPALFWFLLLVRLARGEIPWTTRLRRNPKPLGIILASTVFFALGLGLILFPQEWLPQSWALLAVGVDLTLLGIAVAILDAFDEGETLLPHFLRSFDYALVTALLFGGQVGLVMALSTGVTMPMLLLLLTTVTAAIIAQAFSNILQGALDRFAFFSFPQLRQERAQLISAVEGATRINHSIDLDSLEDAEFAWHTRRALGYMGNLPKLSSNPLTQLSQVERRLTDSNQRSGTLERAAELKSILAESIARLKPPGNDEFGTSDEWRYYNALYFPYVLGLKPYSRRVSDGDGNPEQRKILDWFRREIPQRTLYNWQNAAAKLVAQDLRERSRAARPMLS